MKIRNLASSVLATIAMSGMIATSASAVTLINFDQSNALTPTGVVSYDGNGGPLTTINPIRFDDISLQGATPPSGNQSSLFCQACMLSFTTGTNTSEGSGVGTDWTFAAGGSFVLTGSVFEDRNNTSGTPIASGNLVTGTFTGTPRINRTDVDSLNFNANGTDDKNNDLLTYFGIDPTSAFTFANSEISLGDTVFAQNGGFTSNVTAADLNNRFQPGRNVPEPEELGLFGLGIALLLIGVFSRRSFGGTRAS